MSQEIQLLPKDAKMKSCFQLARSYAYFWHGRANYWNHFLLAFWALLWPCLILLRGRANFEESILLDFRVLQDRAFLGCAVMPPLRSQHCLVFGGSHDRALFGCFQKHFFFFFFKKSLQYLILIIPPCSNSSLEPCSSSKDVPNILFQP